LERNETIKKNFFCFKKIKEYIDTNNKFNFKKNFDKKINGIRIKKSNVMVGFDDTDNYDYE
jgi:hypothetical protein